jgi:hypothetical protein
MEQHTMWGMLLLVGKGRRAKRKVKDSEMKRNKIQDKISGEKT